jgi:hypothetical protein
MAGILSQRERDLSWQFSKVQFNSKAMKFLLHSIFLHIVFIYRARRKSKRKKMTKISNFCLNQKGMRFYKYFNAVREHAKEKYE